MNTADYHTLRVKLQRPVENAREVIIQQSLSERFIQTFLEHVRENPPYILNEEAHRSLDNCIGCLQVSIRTVRPQLCRYHTSHTFAVQILSLWLIMTDCFGFAGDLQRKIG